MILFMVAKYYTILVFHHIWSLCRIDRGNSQREIKSALGTARVKI